MTITEFKEIARLLKDAYKKVEQEAIKDGMNLLSPEYDQIIAQIRETILNKNGFTLEEYRAAKDKASSITKESIDHNLFVIEKKIKDLGDKHIHTEKEILDIANKVSHETAQKYIKPPQIINQIIKEITIEKPTIVKETKVVNIPFDEKPFNERLKEIHKKIDGIKIPDVPLQPNLEKFREELRDEFNISLAKSINILNMPNFRKLAMGLEGRISVLESRPSSSSGVGAWSTPPETPNGSTTVFTVGASAPTDVNSDGIILYDGAGYTYAAGQITFINPPTQFVRYR